MAIWMALFFVASKNKFQLRETLFLSSEAASPISIRSCNKLFHGRRRRKSKETSHRQRGSRPLPVKLLLRPFIFTPVFRVKSLFQFLSPTPDIGRAHTAERHESNFRMKFQRNSSQSYHNGASTVRTKMYRNCTSKHILSLFSNAFEPACKVWLVNETCTAFLSLGCTTKAG